MIRAVARRDGAEMTPILRYLAWAGFAVAIVVGLALIYRVWNDLKGDPGVDSCDPEDVLDPLTRAYAAGQMSREEYERIRDSIGRQGQPAPVRPEDTEPARLVAGLTFHADSLTWRAEGSRDVWPSTYIPGSGHRSGPTPCR